MEVVLLLGFLMASSPPAHKAVPQPDLETCIKASEEFLRELPTAEMRKDGVVGKAASCMYRLTKGEDL